MSLTFDASPEDLVVYLAEGEELLGLLDANVLILEKGGRDRAVIQEIFRAAHTLKGSSAAIGHHRMAQLTHLMESVLDRLRKDEIPVTPELIDLLLQCLDALRVLQGEVATGEESAQDFTALEAQLRATAEGGAATPISQPAGPVAPVALAVVADDRSTCEVEVTLDPNALFPAARCFQVLLELGTFGEVVSTNPTMDVIQRQDVIRSFTVLLATDQDAEQVKRAASTVEGVSGVTVKQPSGAADGRAEPAEVVREDAPARGAQKVAQTVRIDVERLDNLMNLVGELVIDRTRLSRLANESAARLGHDDLSSQIGETAQHLARLTDDLQQEVMKSRMLPVASVFSRFPRLVRDVARKSGKKVELVVEGEDTELDRTVIQEIGDPLIHLLRNAVDHGLEAPEERRAVGKPEVGRVKLSASHEDNFIVITVEDDGRGIDGDKVRASALAKGLISREQAARLNEVESLNLIFAAGLSTAKQVSDLSGRGVGMDIVRTNIEKLGGVVTLSTRLGQGTKFAIKLPVTLAIIPSLLVGLSGDVYAIPLTAVSETLRIDPSRLSTIQGAEAYQLRGHVLPLLDLRAVLGRPVRERRGSKVLVVAVHSFAGEVGLVVDSFLGQQEVVVKSLGGSLGRLPGISGATILGDGRVGLIVDTVSLIDSLAKRGGRAAVAQAV